MRRLLPLLLALPIFAATSCQQQKPAETPSPSNSGSPSSTASSKKLKIGLVLHVLNSFTDVIKRGAEDAGKALDVEVEVVGPSVVNATEAIGMFESMMQKHKDGLVVVPMPGEVWVKPIKEATDAKIPVVTANITSPESAAESWFGQDEYQSGVILAQEIKKALAAEGKTNGTILAGVCSPGVAVLDERYRGFKKELEGSAYQVTDPKDVGIENTANYSAWENQATANPQMIAAVGFCSMDVPNLSKLKTRSNGKWLIGGYDLNAETLASLKAGTSSVSLGQHPYLQGYLPVLALVRHLKEKTPLPKGWVNVGTETVTKANVATVYPRETDRATETKWYGDYIKQNFSDMGKLAQPLPKLHP